MLFPSSIRLYRLKRNSNQAVRVPMIERRRSFFVEAVCYLLEGITVGNGRGRIDFDLSRAFHIHDTGTWGAGADTVLKFINCAKEKDGKTVKKYLEGFLEYGTKIFDKALASPKSQVIPPPPTWEDFMPDKQGEEKNIKISTK